MINSKIAEPTIHRLAVTHVAGVRRELRARQDATNILAALQAVQSPILSLEALYADEAPTEAASREIMDAYRTLAQKTLTVLLDTNPVDESAIFNAISSFNVNVTFLYTKLGLVFVQDAVKYDAFTPQEITDLGDLLLDAIRGNDAEEATRICCAAQEFLSLKFVSFYNTLKLKKPKPQADEHSPAANLSPAFPGRPSPKSPSQLMASQRSDAEAASPVRTVPSPAAKAKAPIPFRIGSERERHWSQEPLPPLPPQAPVATATSSSSSSSSVASFVDEPFTPAPSPLKTISPSPSGSRTNLSGRPITVDELLANMKPGWSAPMSLESLTASFETRVILPPNLEAPAVELIEACHDYLFLSWAAETILTADVMNREASPQSPKVNMQHIRAVDQRANDAAARISSLIKDLGAAIRDALLQVRPTTGSPLPTSHKTHFDLLPLSHNAGRCVEETTTGSAYLDLGLRAPVRGVSNDRPAKTQIHESVSKFWSQVTPQERFYLFMIPSFKFVCSGKNMQTVVHKLLLYCF